MQSGQKIRSEVFMAIQELLEGTAIEITDTTPLIGDEKLLDSMRLVELCLRLEDRASELGFEFDWTSGAAMSRSQSMFRTAGALAAEFLRQMEQHA